MEGGKVGKCPSEAKDWPKRAIWNLVNEGNNVKKRDSSDRNQFYILLSSVSS